VAKASLKKRPIASKKLKAKPAATKKPGRAAPTAVVRPAAKAKAPVNNGKKAPPTVAAKTVVTPPPVRPAPKVAKPPPPYVPQPIPEAVPTNGKPRKNQAGFSPKDLENFRDLLLAKRRELVGDMSAMEREALRSSGATNLSTLPIHMADMGTDNYEQEFTLGLVEKDRNLLKEINSALAKIQNGTFGICEGTGKPISRARLEAAPWARFSIEWARKLERPGRM
jgi:RNA polymerase-binding protein DksA